MEPIGSAGQRRALLGQLCALLAGGPKWSSARLGSREGAQTPAGADAAALDACRTRARAARSRGAAETSVFVRVYAIQPNLQKLVVHAYGSIISQLPRAIA